MSILLQTQHTHMSTAQRVVRMVIGMSVIVGCALAAINYSPLVDGAWLAIAMWPAAYLMFIGFIGVDPLTLPRKRQTKPIKPIVPFVVHSR